MSKQIFHFLPPSPPTALLPPTPDPTITPNAPATLPVVGSSRHAATISGKGENPRPPGKHAPRDEASATGRRRQLRCGRRRRERPVSARRLDICYPCRFVVWSALSGALEAHKVAWVEGTKERVRHGQILWKRGHRKLLSHRELLYLHTHHSVDCYRFHSPTRSRHRRTQLAVSFSRMARIRTLSHASTKAHILTLSRSHTP